MPTKSVRIPEEQYRAIEQKAKADERTIIYHIKKAIDKYCGAKTAKLVDKPKKPRAQKPQEWKDFFAAYPANKKGGTDSAAWQAAQRNGLTTQDYICMLEDTINRSRLQDNWHEKYAPGICKYINERIWETPIFADNEHGQANRKTQDIPLEEELSSNSWVPPADPTPGCPDAGILGTGTDE